ncbi:MAG: tetratricopeptide repeat protein [Verrucomicrobiota bacterium]
MPLPRVIVLCLIAVTLALYVPVSSHEFLHYDDDNYVTHNDVVKAGLTVAGVKWAFTTRFAANWFPFTWLSHMVDCELFKLNAGAHHLGNALFHAVNSALLFWLWFRLTSKIWPAAFVAMLFAWHPLHVESVAWIAERKDVLSTFFGLLTLLSYAKYVQQPSRSHYWLALTYYALALMSKPMLVTLPFLLLLIDYWPLQRFAWSTICWRFFREKLPFFILATIACLVTLKVQSPAISSTPMPSSLRLGNAIYAIGHYLSQTLWPTCLSIFYPFRAVPIQTAAMIAAVLLAISLTTWLARERNRCWMVGWLWFLGTLMPVIGIVQVGSAAMADRYMYIPTIGIFIAIGFGLSDLKDKWPRSKNFLAGGTVFIMAVCMALTEKQLGYWKNGETLFRHVLAATGSSYNAHNYLGVALEKQERYEEALAEYCLVVTINPTDHRDHFPIGNMLIKLGRPAAALNEYHQCLTGEPANAVYHTAVGNAWAAQDKFSEAMAAFTQARKLDASLPLPHIGMAYVLLKQGSHTHAVEELWTAVRIAPHDVQALSTVARVLATHPDATVRDGPNAVVIAGKANEFSHGLQRETWDALGMAFAEIGDYTNAIACTANAMDLCARSETRAAKSISIREKSYRNGRPWREPFSITNLPIIH